MAVETRSFAGHVYRRYPGAKNKNKQRYFTWVSWDSKRRKYISHALHRDIWESKHGPIPKGYSVHHKNNDWGNNSVRNLVCMSGSDHRRLHGGTEEFKTATRKFNATPRGQQIVLTNFALAQGPRRVNCELCGKLTFVRGHGRFCKRPGCVRKRRAAYKQNKRSRTRIVR